MHLFKDLPIRKKLLLIILGVNLFVLTLAFNDSADAAETLAAFKADQSIVGAWIMTQPGHVLASYGRNGSQEPPSTPPRAQDGCYFENGCLFCSRLISLEGIPIGAVVIQSDLKVLHSVLKNQIGVIGLVLLISFLCAALLSSRLQRLITEPVIKLAGLATKVSKEKNYSIRAAKQAEDECGILIDAFNDMLEQIQSQNAILIRARQKAETSAQDALRLAEEMQQNNLKLEEEIRARRRAEEELHIYQAYLEQMVTGRTAELKYSTEKLALEVEERRAAKVRLRASLDEKSTLLGEIHHRVRNNLQIISSLLGLTRRRTSNADARQIIEETQSRIFAIAIIHSHLYRSDDFNRIDMESHIKRLWSSIPQIHEPLQEIVTPVIRCGEIYLTMPQAVPCSLVLNEAVTNVFKYAYEKGKGGPCHISMERCGNDRVRLRIKDEGRGIPEAVDVDTTETLGLKLMRNLVRRQLGGEFRIERNGGTEIWIEFALSPEDQFTLEREKDEAIGRTHSNRRDDASFEMTGRDIA